VLLGFLLSALVVMVFSRKGNSSKDAVEVRIPRGAGGVGFLPLLVMEKKELIQTHAKAAGLTDLKVEFLDRGGPNVVNVALLAGEIDFAAAGPPAFLIWWHKDKVKGVAAMTSLPMYLNVRDDRLKTLEDFTDGHKIGMTSPNVSIPAIALQIYAEKKYGDVAHFDRFAQAITHDIGVNALKSRAITAHFTSPPFHQRERKDPKVRTIMTTDDVLGGSATFTMLYTTAAFYKENPKVVKVVLDALEEANRRILEDKKMAAELLLAEMSSGSTAEGGYSLEDMLEVINDPSVKFTTTPENVMKYAEFMHHVGTIEKKPTSWKEMFFPEIHGKPGN
jgi:NitT/TauT family transport system substrate-binding protein